MSHETIYLDNAATSFPKPPQVIEAVTRALRELGSPGRGAHSRSLAASREMFETRLAVADFLSCPSDRLMFTPGCTYSINFVLNGLALTRGDTIVISALQHNAVARPLQQLHIQRGIKIHEVPHTPGQIVSAHDLEQALREHNPKLCVLVDGSNVTGEMCDLTTLAPICKKFGVPLLVDAAQTAGRHLSALNIDGITFWAASAHKGFYAPPGLGLLYVRNGWELAASICGGTGSGSENLLMPNEYPDKLESGTLPIHAIAGLHAGVRFILENDPETIGMHENRLAAQFTEWCKSHSNIRLLSGNDHERQLPIVSFAVDGHTPDRVADLLDTKFGIAVRSGLHCAANAHATLGTTNEGAVRASFGFFNTEQDVEQLTTALSQISRQVSRAPERAD